MHPASGYLLITGAASGLGAACVDYFSARNWPIAAIDLRWENPNAAEESANIARYSADVCDEAAIRAAIESANQRWGRPWGLIHCAGVLGAAKTVGRSGPHNLALFERVIRVNLIGTFNVARLAAQAMAAAEPDADGQRGVIVMTSSVAAEDGQMGQAAYAASKGGVASMTLPMARDLASLGIRVLSIAPGVFDTPMMKAAPDAVRESLLKVAQFPRRFGKGEEFAALVDAILQNPMLNGAFLRLDGAMRMPAT